jgi:hypothetical protein
VVEQVADQDAPRAEGPSTDAAVADPDETASGASDDAPPLPPGMGEVHFRNRNTTWTNVYVGDELHELRQNQEFRLQLSAGDHPVRIGDFRDKETWWTGQVRVEAGQRLELQFSRASAPRVMEHPDAWVEVAP